MFITIDDILKLNNPNIIDIRSIQKFNDNHIPGSLNINADLLLSNPEKYLHKNQTYYIYCQYGVTSRKVVQILRIKGYSVFSIVGGFESWILKF